MNYEQSDLDLMKRDVDEFGVEALLTPEALKLLIADLEEARESKDYAWQNTREIDKVRMKAEAEVTELRKDKARLDWQEKEFPHHSIVMDGARRWHEVATEGGIFRGDTFREAIDAARESAR